MINIKKIKDQITKEVIDRVCERYGVSKNEVKVTFKTDGDISVTISPKEFISSLNVKLTIEDKEV